MQNPSAPNIILASSSRYRRGLLDRFLDEFETVAPGVDEAASAEAASNKAASDKAASDGAASDEAASDEAASDALDPEAIAAHLARSKAEAVSSRYRQALVIGADQVAVLDGAVLGKPGNHARAVEQLLAASGKTMQFLTAVCVLDPVSRRRYQHIDRTVVRFRKFDLRQVEAYLRHDQPYDCAGSFKIEGAGFVLFRSVSTEDPTALIGLPMIWLAATLRELGHLLP